LRRLANRRLDGVASTRHVVSSKDAAFAVIHSETLMVGKHLRKGLRCLALCSLTLTVAALGQTGQAADQFPFDRELLLDAAPMRPAKRVPILTVAANGDATIDLWCKTVSARVELADATIKIEPGALPEALPAMMGADQCTPQRMRADEDMLATLAQMTTWRHQDGALVLDGPKTLKFRAATN
jgi:heat shock protein HslJ